MHLTEMLGAMLNAKMDLTAFWPMRMKYKKPTLLDYKTDQPSILYQIHQQLAQNLTGSLVQTTAPANVPAFASYSGTSSTVVMSGSKIDKPTQVSINVPGKQKFNSCKVWRISGAEFDYKITTLKLSRKQEGGFGIELKPSEVLIVVFE